MTDRRTSDAGRLIRLGFQDLERARRLCASPRLAPLLVEEVFNVVRALKSQGMTIFLVEQNAFHALKLAHRGYVMVNGVVTMSGTGKDLLANPQVRAAYLEGGRH